MQQLNSISLGLMSLGLIVLGLVFEDALIRIVVLTAAALLSIVAVIKSFKEKNKNKK